MVTRATDREAVDKAGMDNSNHRLCKLLQIMGMQTKVVISLVVVIITVDACRMVPVIMDRTIKEMDRMATMITAKNQVGMKTIKIKTILVTNPVGVALAGMVDPAADLAADLPEAVDLLAVDLLVVDLLVGPLADQTVDLEETLEDRMDQGGLVA